MNGAFNGFSINGSASPNWVVRAVVAAVAAATVTAAPVRNAYGQVLADASVVVTLTDTHVIAGRATGSAAASSATFPSLLHAGRSLATADATGLAAVRRDVFAFAAADGTATGQAIPASKIGQSNATATATVILCEPYEIVPGACLGTAIASTASALGKATRYPTVLAPAGIEYTRAESRIQLNGQSVWRHDGFVPPGRAIAGCSGSVAQDRAVIIATIGAFLFGESNATVSAAIKYRAVALGQSACTDVQAFGAHLRSGALAADAAATATASATRTTRSAATGLADASHFQIRALVNYKAQVSAQCDATLAQPIVSLRNAAGRATALAEASLANFAGYGTQHYAVAGGLSGASIAAPTAILVQQASATGQAEAALGAPTTFGAQYRGAAVSPALSFGVAAPVQQWAGSSSSQALCIAEFAVYASQAFGQASTTASGSGAAEAVLQHMGDANVNAASTGIALAFANSDVQAPADRYMVVPADDRVMVVGFEERLMVAA